MPTAQEYEKLMEIAQSSKAINPVQAVDRGAITQSYYTTPTTSKNYEKNRPAYEQSDAVGDAANALMQHTANRPQDYQSQYDGQISELIQNAMNRPAFNYDYSTDENYGEYARRYDEQGREALAGALEETEQLTGGYGNSYGDKVGAQTYQRWLQNRDLAMPAYMNQAYREYAGDAAQDAQNLAMLQEQEARDYGRYRDQVGDWRNDLSFLYTQYNAMSQQEYNRYLNDQSSWEADRAYWYKKAYDEQQQRNWEKEFDAQYGQKGGGGGGRRRDAAEYIDEHGIDPSNVITDVLAEAQRKRREKYEGGTARAIYV